MTRRLRELLKRCARGVLGDYEPYVIFRLDRADRPPRLPRAPDGVVYGAEPSDAVAADPAPEIREQSGYGGEGALFFAAREHGRIIATLWCWHGRRYAQRGFLDLQPDEVKIVHVYTATAARGRGVGSGLLQHACAELLAERFRSVLARVWVTNRPSRRMFVGAGFRPVQLVIVLRPWPRRRALRLELRSPAVLRRLGR